MKARLPYTDGETEVSETKQTLRMVPTALLLTCRHTHAQVALTWQHVQVASHKVVTPVYTVLVGNSDFGDRLRLRQGSAMS